MEFVYADGSKLVKTRDDENKKTIYVLLDQQGNEISKVESFDEELGSIIEIDSEIPLHVLAKRRR